MCRRTRLRVLVLAVGLLVVGCGTASTGPVQSAASTPGPAPSAAPAELPGELTGLYPYERAELAVVGVAADDTLSVRAGPGTEFGQLAELAPLADGFTATGQNRTLPDRSTWVEVQTGAGPGWVNGRFVAQAGGTDDVTAALGGPIRAGSMTELAAAVVEARLPERGDATVTVVDGPRSGDLDEVVVDVLGLADDAQAGERLHVFAVRAGGTHTARTVEATVLCARGVTAGGDCV